MLFLLRCCSLAVFLVVFSCPVQAGNKHKSNKEKKAEKEKAEEANFARQFPRYLNKVAPPEWMLRQIRTDLAPFYKSGVSAAAMDAMMQKDASEGELKRFIRCKIVNGQMEVSFASDPSRYEEVTNALKTLAQAIHLPNLDFIITLHDFYFYDHSELLSPIFVFAKSYQDEPMVILIPDFEALGGRAELIKSVHEGNAKYPWSTKWNKAVWRGSRTGGVYNDDHFLELAYSLDNFLKFPRSKAVTFSLKHPELLDARFSLYAQAGGEQQRAFPDYFGDVLSIQDHLRYKYQLLIDGNSCAYSGTIWRLFSNSVTLKQTSDAIQWYYGALRPYVHYIPISSDLSDLAEVIEWVKRNDSVAEQISRRAHAFAVENLTDLRTMQYLYYLLMEYARLPFHP